MSTVTTAASSPGRAGDRAPAESLVELMHRRLDDAADRRAIVDTLAEAVTPAEAGPGDTRATAWTWGELIAAAVTLADAFAAAGLAPGDRVAHVGPHAPDWILVDFACLLAGVVHVPLHADAARSEQLDQLAWLEPRGVVFSAAAVPGGISARDVRGRIVIEVGAGGPQAAVGLAGSGWRGLAAAPEALVDRVALAVERCDPDAAATIVLSSGTTGMPHGVLHSQRSLAANAAAAADVFLDDPRDVRLSWLPMSHAMARTGDLGTALVRGGCLSVVRHRTRVLDACRILPPTAILGVPAFYERLERAAASGRIVDLAAALGGDIRVCVSGGAPLRRRTAEFFAARGVPLVEGYGLAEAGPVIALSNPRMARSGTVGLPLAGIHVRRDERPATRGQLLVSTPSRALGILMPPVSPGGPAQVSPADSGDGWLETGDLAEIDDAGHVRITGRLRDTLVLSNGVKLPPAAVEAALAEDDAVAQVCLVGAGLPRPVAIIVPEPEVLRGAIHRMGLRVFSRRQAVGHPRVAAWLARRLARRQRALPQAWRVKTFLLADRGFDAAHGEATESLKLKREAIAAHFRDRVGRAAAAARSSEGGTMSEPLPAADGGSWLPAALWQGRAGGFAAAASSAAEPLSNRAEAVLDRAEVEIARLRAAGQLYDPLATPPAVAPPIDDPPPPQTGTFSAVAEAVLGEAGLWGLAVPEAFGGSGVSMLDLTRVITRLAANVPTCAGLLAVHSSIGAVSAVTGFGSVEQQARLLPGLRGHGIGCGLRPGTGAGDARAACRPAPAHRHQDVHHGGDPRAAGEAAGHARRPAGGGGCAAARGRHADLPAPPLFAASTQACPQRRPRVHGVRRRPGRRARSRRLGRRDADRLARAESRPGDARRPGRRHVAAAPCAGHRPCGGADYLEAADRLAAAGAGQAGQDRGVDRGLRCALRLGGDGDRCGPERRVGGDHGQGGGQRVRPRGGDRCPGGTRGPGISRGPPAGRFVP